MTESRVGLENLVTAWISHYTDIHVWGTDQVLVERDRSETEWASNEVIRRSLRDPESLWDFILAVVEKNPPDSVIENLSAGPLEDLLARCGSVVIDKVEAQARMCPRFRSVLGGVWRHGMSDDVWERVKACRDTSEWADARD